MATSETTKRGRGRPAFEPTDEMRDRVSIAAGAGMRHEDIAIGLDIHPDTLRKHFAAELSIGANSRRMEVIEALFLAAKRGSSSAAKAFLAVEPRLAAPPAPLDPDGQVTPAPTAKPEPVGKKAQAAAEAVTAHQGTDWEDLLRPPTPLQ